MSESNKPTRIVIEDSETLQREVARLICERAFSNARSQGASPELIQLREEVETLELKAKKKKLELDTANLDADIAEARAREHKAKSMVPRHERQPRQNAPTSVQGPQRVDHHGDRPQRRERHEQPLRSPIRGLEKLNGHEDVETGAGGA